MKYAKCRKCGTPIPQNGFYQFYWSVLPPDLHPFCTCWAKTTTFTGVTA